ncbi:hypothetical protein [Pseudomonas koreensis]
MKEKLNNLLSNIIDRASDDFSGIGLIVWNGRHVLPIFPMRTATGIRANETTAENLTRISTLQSDFHDGFHVLAPDLALVKVAQYFSPPIVHGISINRDRGFGGRYLAALFGSVVSGVEFTAIATPSLGIAIFQHGQEIYFKGL